MALNSTFKFVLVYSFDTDISDRRGRGRLVVEIITIYAIGVRIPLRRGVLDTTVCDTDCKGLVNSK
jgi:hypothetical protein